MMAITVPTGKRGTVESLVSRKADTVIITPEAVAPEAEMPRML
jgi:hypothetical protein